MRGYSPNAVLSNTGASKRGSGTVKGVIEESLWGQVPTGPGVYTFWEGSKELYIGKAKNLHRRVSSYRRNKSDKVQKLLKAATDLSWVEVSSEANALTLERELIAKSKPPFNVKLKDSGRAAQVLLTSGPVPRLSVGVGVGGFGPWSGMSAKEALNLVSSVTQVASCSEGTFKSAVRMGKPCMLADLGKCSAPCVSAGGYEDQVHLATKLLRGEVGGVLNKFTEQMEEAASEMEYEKAASLRDRIRDVQRLVSAQTILEGSSGTFCALAVNEGPVTGWGLVQVSRGVVIAVNSGIAEEATQGDVLERISSQVSHLVGTGGEVVTETKRKDRAEALELARKASVSASAREAHRVLSDVGNLTRAAGSLGEAAGLSKGAFLVAGVDVAHLYGEHGRGSVVLLRDGVVVKRKVVTLSEAVTGNDVASIEAVCEAGKDLLESADLCLIDGGEAQLKSAERVLKGSHLVGLEKRFEVLKTLEGEVVLSRNDPGLLLAMRVRDEAHKVANDACSRAAAKALTRSGFESVPGVGPKTARSLTTVFSGVKGARGASKEAFLQVPGVGEKLAGELEAFFANS